jgi:hypothetical protein
MPLLDWVCTLGGPLLLIPAALAPQWRGNDSSDYDGACDDLSDVHEEEYEACGSLAVGDGRALVLDHETSTAGVLWRDGAALLRGVAFDTAEAARAYLDGVTGWKPTALALTLGEGGLLAFDAAFAGHADPTQIQADYGVLHLGLPPGRYRVDCAVPDEGRVYLLRFWPESPR